MRLDLYFISLWILLSACGVRENSSELESKNLRSYCLNACPEVQKGNRLVDHSIFALSNNPMTKFADWAAYRITPKTLGDGPSKDRSWSADPSLPEDETLEPTDYEGAFEQLQVDRGHQVPLASFAGTEYWKKTNHLSNITPQKSALNQGPWKRLEDIERKLSQERDDGVWVLTGPLFQSELEELPNADEQHTVPSGYWKIIFLKEGSEQIVGSFVFAQEADKDDEVCTGLIGLSSLAKKARMDFKKVLSSKGQDENAQFSSLIGC